MWVFHQMEQQNRAIPLPSSNNDVVVVDSYSLSSASVPPPLVETEVDAHAQQQDHNNGHRRHQRRPRSDAYRFSHEGASSFQSGDVRSDAWSCFVVLLTFWFFASITLILGYYGSFTLHLGPYCSYLIEASPIFVNAVKAQQVQDQIEGPMLYGFHKKPSLEVNTTWSQNRKAVAEPGEYKSWAYYLNAGSQINISYDVIFPSSTPLSFAIAQGQDNLLDWMNDPSYPNTTLCWKIINGSGNITQDITTSDSYYIALATLNKETAVVDLNITIRSLLYNTSNAYFKCSLNSHVCSFKLLIQKPNAAIVTSPGPGQVNYEDDWHVKVSFGAQWATYLVGSITMTAIILAMFRCCNKCQVDNVAIENEAGAEQEPLLSPKDDNGSSGGSSYDSVSSDEDLEEQLLESALEGKAPKEGEANINPRLLCVICFDAPRDCFFLPCGHCAACFTCGSRILEEAGTCPICRRKIKKVRKIFPV